jgi:hypothetical protein
VTVDFKLFGVRGREVLVVKETEARNARTAAHTMVWEVCMVAKGLKITNVEAELLKDFRGKETTSEHFEWERSWMRRFAKAQDAKWR